MYFVLSEAESNGVVPLPDGNDMFNSAEHSIG